MDDAKKTLANVIAFVADAQARGLPPKQIVKAIFDNPTLREAADGAVLDAFASGLTTPAQLLDFLKQSAR